MRKQMVFAAYRLDEYDRDRLRQVAKQRGIKSSALVRQLVQRYLESLEVDGRVEVKHFDSKSRKFVTSTPGRGKPKTALEIPLSVE